MSNPFRTRLCLNGLEGRAVPSEIAQGPEAFAALDVAVVQFCTGLQP
jgi:hypothetical protein